MNKIILGDVIEGLSTLPEKCVQTCVTSPPYFGLRDYGVEGQIGLEETPDAYVQRLVEVFREVKRVLKDDGTVWLNLGDSYASTKVGNTNGTYGKIKQKVGVNEDTRIRTISQGLKHKDLIGIPWRVAFALQVDGWYLRQDIIWSKPNPMPESVTDRCTKSHEYIFLLSKSSKYYFNNQAIKEPAIYGSTGRLDRAIEGQKSNPTNQRNGIRPRDNRAGKGRIAYEGKRTEDITGKNGQESFVSISETRNKRSVWTVTTKPYKGAHFATFPSDLIEPCILAGSREGDLVLDPFMGSGTTAAVAIKNGRQYVGTELNPEYIKLAEQRLSTVQTKLNLS